MAVAVRRSGGGRGNGASAALARENATRRAFEARVDGVSYVALVGIGVGILGMAFAIVLAWLERASSRVGAETDSSSGSDWGSDSG